MSRGKVDVEVRWRVWVMSEARRRKRAVRLRDAMGTRGFWVERNVLSQVGVGCRFLVVRWERSWEEGFGADILAIVGDRMY